MKPDRWKHIEKIYQQAKQHDASARRAFLDEACSGDAELRRQVESLLKADNDAESFLDIPAMNLAAQMMADEKTPSLVGKRISRYEIVEQIGAGGMGEVYRAKDIRLNREVAIKVLPAHMSNNAEAMARFEREARAVAALSHSNILAIHDFGNEDGVCYSVTELLEGETLRTRLIRSALAWRDAVEIGIAVADGLSAAHAKGIIHRDLKPENIFLLKGSAVKVLDFGLARVQVPSINSVNTTAVAEPCMTEPGRVLGTIGYMSPEQVRGEKVDARSDVFSLGCVLYEMVARRRAFAGETPAEKMAAILRDEPQRLRHLDKKAPHELERVITRCLDKKPDERYQSADDLAADLKGMVSAAEVSLPARPIKSVYPTIWIAAALLVLSAIALTYWLTRGSQPAEHTINSIAVLPLVNASGDEGLDYLSDGITESLINSLSQLFQLHVVARPIVFRYKGQEIDPMKVGDELTVRAVLTGKMILRGETLSIQADLIDATNGAELWGDRYDRKITDILAVQNEIARRISEKLRLQLTGEEQQRLAKRYTESVEAYKLYLTGRFHENKLTE
ncbi:MAG TPA: serine/threonine-protein kinase, partial [Blastocatellia bacterium]|nr:serine/threonine-protein kinase [Blastocatellia bacterium]